MDDSEWHPEEPLSREEYLSVAEEWLPMQRRGINGQQAPGT